MKDAIVIVAAICVIAVAGLYVYENVHCVDFLFGKACAVTH